MATSGVICASEAPETALEDVAVVGADRARAAVEEEAAEDEEGVDLRPLRGEATAMAGLAQAVRARWDAGADERGATTTPERAVLAANIVISFSLSECSSDKLCSDAGKAQRKGKRREFRDCFFSFFAKGKRELVEELAIEKREEKRFKQKKLEVLTLAFFFD